MAKGERMRLIDADALKEQIKIMQSLGANIPIMHMIENAPTVDAVEVVRCKDCTSFHGGSCYVNRIEMSENDFCSWGERKDEVTG
jgi:hypothetical protein